MLPELLSLIQIPKTYHKLTVGQHLQIAVDDRLLKAITDVSKYHFPLLPVQFLLPQFNGKVFITTDISTVYHEVVLSFETQN